MNPTSEQQDIVNDVLNNKHVSVTALPGSGKSSVAYEIVRQCKNDKSIIMIMFNRSLCDETNHALSSIDIGGREVKAFTFHGLIGSILGETCLDDRNMSILLPKLRNVSVDTDWSMGDFTILIIDEVQDMRPGFFELVRILIENVCQNRQKLRIVLLGDPKQLLYDFYNYNRADSRFLTLGHYLLANTNRFGWSTRRLSQSFRSTPAVAAFLNAIVPDQQMIPRDCVVYEPVDLYILDIYKDPRKYILSILSPYEPDDVMILCASLNERSPAKSIVKVLSDHNIPVYVHRSGSLMDTNTSTMVSLTKGKVEVKTFHASKGLQRKLVIVINNSPMFSSIQNSTFVGMSRSITKLVIFHDMHNTSWDELETLSTKLNNDKRTLRIHITPSTHVPYSCANSQKQLEKLKQTTTMFKTESMFSYIDPSILVRLERFLCHQKLHDTFTSSDQYSSLFDIHCKDGMYRNMTRIVSMSLRIAILYHYTHNLPTSVHTLKRKSVPCTLLYNRGMELMTNGLFYLDDPWALENTILKFQSFAMFALALDADIGFQEQILQVSDFSFIMKPEVINRFIRAVNVLEEYIPYSEKGCRIEHTYRKGIMGTPYKITHCPTIHDKKCVFMMIHTPSTTVDMILSTTVSMACLSIFNGIIANIHTGEIILVRSKAEEQTFLLHECIRACTLVQDDLDDNMFIDTYRIN